MGILTKVLTGAVAAVTVAVQAPPAHAAPVELFRFAGTEISTSPLDLPCLPFTGTITEARSADGLLVIHPDGETHVQMSVTASVTIAPDETSDAQVYEGTYREHVAGRFMTVDGEDVPLVMTFVVPLRVTAADGSTVRALLKGHVTTTPDGTMRVMSQEWRCVGP